MFRGDILRRARKAFWFGVGRAVQEAKLSGYTVYATASLRHHEDLKGLGASRALDYKFEGKLKEIIDAAEDGLELPTGCHAIESRQLSVDA